METQTILLNHALELFAARGYDAVGVQELASAAGVTKPTLYHHFGNKQGVLKALISRDSQPLLEQLKAVTHYRGDLPLNLKTLVGSYLTFVDRQPDFYRLLAACYLAPPESDSYRLAYPVHEQQHGLVEALFEQAGRDHGNMRGRARRYAHSFVGLINTYLLLALAGEVRVDAQLEHDVVHQFSHGIYS